MDEITKLRIALRAAVEELNYLGNGGNIGDGTYKAQEVCWMVLGDLEGDPLFFASIEDALKWAIEFTRD